MISRPIKIITDSQSVIDWINNPRVNNLNNLEKHISRKYHFVKDEKVKGEIAMKYVKTSDLEADLMTKDLSHEKISKHIASLGMLTDY